MKTFKQFFTEVYPVIWNDHNHWKERVQKEFGNDVTYHRSGSSTEARKGKEVVGNWHHGEKNGIVYKHVKEDWVDDADKKAVARGSAPLTHHQKFLLRTGTFKKDAPPALAQDSVGIRSGRFVRGTKDEPKELKTKEVKSEPKEVRHFHTKKKHAPETAKSKIFKHIIKALTGAK